MKAAKAAKDLRDHVSTGAGFNMPAARGQCTDDSTWDCTWTLNDDSMDAWKTA